MTMDGGLFVQRYKTADNNIVIISINDLTQYEAANSPELNLTRWPWSREVWAKVINIVLATALRTQIDSEEEYDASKILDNFENPYSPSSDPLSMHIYNKELDKNITYYSHTPIPNIFTNSTTMGVTNLVTNIDNKEENIRYSQPV